MGKETNNVVSTTAEPTANVTTTEPTLEDLKAQLAEAKAQSAKHKAERDKALKEKGDVTKQLRARQTAEEQEEEAKKEAERLREEQFEEMSRELNHMKAISAYQGVTDADTIETLIDSVKDGDHVSIAKVIENIKNKAVKDARAEWIKSSPQAAVGVGEYASMTKEQFDKMVAKNDVAGLTKFKREHPEEYTRYMKF